MASASKSPREVLNKKRKSYKRQRFKEQDEANNPIPDDPDVWSMASCISQDNSTEERSTECKSHRAYSSNSQKGDESLCLEATDTDEAISDTNEDIVEGAGDTDNGSVRYRREVQPTPDSQKQQLKTEIFQMPIDKDSTAFDFWPLLEKYKLLSYPSAHLVSNDGLNILQFCIDKGKLSFLLIIVYIGWWRILSQQKVPDTATSEHRGKVAKEIAEAKKARKPLEEYNKANELENSLSPLLKSIRNADKALAMSIIQSSPEELYYTDFNGSNSLHWAIVSNSLDIFKELYSRGVDHTIRTKKRENLLHTACLLGRDKFVPTLLTECKVDTQLEDTGHKTPLDRVAENGDLPTLKAFADCGVPPKPDCIVIAAHFGRLPFVIHCVENLKINVNSTDLYGRTAIHRACEAKRGLVINYLLNKHADLVLPTCTNKNTLHYLAEAGDVEQTKLVLSKLSPQQIKSMIDQQDLFCGEHLCFLIRGRDKGRDAFHYVEVERAKVPIFHKKTKSGNVDVALFGIVIKSGWGVNPSQEDTEEIEAVFKSRKFDPESPPDTTPLHVAAFKGHSSIAVILMEMGANVNIRDKFGNTPLMVAASKGDKDTILELLQRGANIDAVNQKGMNAVDIADENQQDGVIHLMTGQELGPLCQNFVTGVIGGMERALSPDELYRVRSSGADVRRHIIDSLRDMRIDVNEFLVKIGSGPVLEATD